MNNERYRQIIDEAYENYCKSFENQSTIEQYSFDTDPMSQLMFIGKIKTISEFSEKWGLKIEERELNRLERIQLGIKAEWKPKDYIENFEHKDLNGWNIPTKLITITHKDEIIEVYE